MEELAEFCLDFAARKKTCLLQELTCTSFSGALHSTFGRRNKGV